MEATAHRLLAAAVASMLALAFAWPLDPALDPAAPAWRWTALVSLAVFLAGLVLGRAARARK